MPGLWGIVGGTTLGDAETLFHEMGDRLQHHDFYGMTTHRDAAGWLRAGLLSLGKINTATQPAFNEDGSLGALMTGEIYDAEDLRRALKSAGHEFRGESHAEILLHGYEQSGRDFFRSLNGIFAAAIWDARRRACFWSTTVSASSRCTMPASRDASCLPRRSRL